MSDEEAGWNEEPEEEKHHDHHAKRVEEPTEQKTEAQLLIEAKMKKQEDEDQVKLREIEEQRRIQREKEDEELRRLKEKQEQRRKQREEEERLMEEQKRALEEARKREEEERKQKADEEKRKKQEEAERKKAAAQAAMVGGRNFVIKDRESDAGETQMDKFMNISKAKAEMGLNTGELEALKRKTISDRIKPLSIDGLSNSEMKAKADELWKLIISLETAIYDLDERNKRQDYDLRELNERQRQINQKKYAAQGLNPEEASSRHPPKVQICSKHERRVDRRTYTDKRGLFEAPKKEEDKEFNKPKAKKRETWIKDKKEEERKRPSYDELEEEMPNSNGYGGGYGNQNGNHEEESHHQEEVAVEEEEE